MSENYGIEENFEILKQMLVNSRQTVKHLEQQKIELENNVITLTDINKSMKDSNHRLLDIIDKLTQQIMFCKFDLSSNDIDLLKTELEEYKKENLKLKSSLYNTNVPNSHGGDRGTIESYVSLLQKKIVDLEKQLLQNQKLIIPKSSLHCTKHEKELSTLKIKNNELFLENNSLKEQLISFRTLHHQVVSEIKLKNSKYANGDDQQVKNNPSRCNSPMVIDVLDQDELKPIQVHIIDSDED